MADRCRSCGAEIVWAATEKGKRMPVDAEHSRDGTVLLAYYGDGEAPRARVIGKAERERLSTTSRVCLHKSHFATCPQAAAHRR